MFKKIMIALLLLSPFVSNTDAKDDFKLEVQEKSNKTSIYGFGELERERVYREDYRSSASCYFDYMVRSATRYEDRKLVIEASYGKNLSFNGTPEIYADVSTGVSGAKKYRVVGKITKKYEKINDVIFEVPMDQHYTGRTLITLKALEGSCTNSVKVYHYTGRKLFYENLVFSLSALGRVNRVLDWQESTNNAILFDKNQRWNQYFKLEKVNDSYRIVSSAKTNHRLGTFRNNDVSIRNDTNCTSDTYTWDIELLRYHDRVNPTIKLKNKRNDRYLDVPYSNYANRNHLTTYHKTNNLNQEFVLNGFSYMR